MDIAEPADVSVHDSGAIAPTLPAATNPRPLRKEDPAVLVPIPALARKNPARRRSPLTPYPPTALHLVRPSYSLQHHYVPRKPQDLSFRRAKFDPDSILLVIPTPKAEESSSPRPRASPRNRAHLLIQSAGAGTSHARHTTANAAATRTGHGWIARTPGPERGHVRNNDTESCARFAYRPSAVLRSRSPRNLDQLWGLRALPMISRPRFLITAAFVCHLLLAPRLVTSQLRSVPNSTLTPPAASPSQGSSAAAPSLPAPLPQARPPSLPDPLPQATNPPEPLAVSEIQRGVDVRIQATQQEKDGPVYKL